MVVVVVTVVTVPSSPTLVTVVVELVTVFFFAEQVHFELVWDSEQQEIAFGWTPVLEHLQTLSNEPPQEQPLFSPHSIHLQAFGLLIFTSF